MRLATACDELGLGLDATPEEAKKAYRRLALQHHPDKAGNSPEATAKFQRIQEAFTKLQEADEIGMRYDEEDEEDDYGFEFDEDFYGDYYEEEDDLAHAFFEQFFYARAGFPGHGPFGGRGPFGGHGFNFAQEGKSTSR